MLRVRVFFFFVCVCVFSRDTKRKARHLDGFGWGVSRTRFHQICHPRSDPSCHEGERRLLAPFGSKSILGSFMGEQVKPRSILSKANRDAVTLRPPASWCGWTRWGAQMKEKASMVRGAKCLILEAPVAGGMERKPKDTQGFNYVLYFWGAICWGGSFE